MKVELLTCVIGVFLCLAAGVLQADTQFNGSVDDDWAKAGNWSSGVPGSGGNARIDLTADAVVYTAGAEAKRVYVDNGRTLTIETGGYLTLPENNGPPAFRLGDNGDATFVLNGGTLHHGDTYGDDFKCGMTDGSTVNIYVNGGLWETRNIRLGEYGSGNWPIYTTPVHSTVNFFQTGGTIDLHAIRYEVGEVYIPTSSGATATYTMNGGDLYCTHIRVCYGGTVAEPAYGTFNLNSGYVSAWNVILGWGETTSVTSVATFNQTGGDIYIIDLWIGGNEKQGTYKISGGTLEVYSSITNGSGGRGIFEVIGSGAVIDANSYSQYDSSKLKVEIGPTGISTINVWDIAEFDSGSMLEVSLADGFTPSNGQQYTLLSADSALFDYGLVNVGDDCAHWTFAIVGGTDLVVTYHTAADSGRCDSVCQPESHDFTGSVDNDWFNIGNWSNNCIPIFHPDDVANIVGANAEISAPTAVSGDVHIANNRTLSFQSNGGLSITGTLFNGNSGSDIGTLEVVGGICDIDVIDYAQSSNSVLKVVIGSDGVSTIDVYGSATFDSGAKLDVSLDTGVTLSEVSQFTVLTASDITDNGLVKAGGDTGNWCFIICDDGRLLVRYDPGGSAVCNNVLHCIGQVYFAGGPDINRDRKINFIDAAIAAGHWMDDDTPTGGGFCGDINHPMPPGDLTGDCIVNGDDFKIFALAWLGSPISGIERANALKDELFESPDHEWAKWMVVNFAPTRIHFTPWTDAERQLFLDTYDPDHIGEWGGPSLNRADFCRMRGVASNTTLEYSFQEDLNELQSHSTVEMFDNGIGRKEDGSLANGGWSGNYIMCHNAPKWQELCKQSPARQAVYGESIFHDKLGTALSWQNTGYCAWCNRRFKTYLQERFVEGELWGMGFDPDTFDLTTHVADKRQTMTAAQLLEEPIIHEYIRFQYMNHLYWMVDIIDQYHQCAAKADMPIPAFYGNQEVLSGQCAYSVIISDHVDIVWSEQSEMFQRPLHSGIQAFGTLLWKVGRAASHYKRAVSSLQYQGAAWTDKKYPTALANAEATANGGVQCQTWSASPFCGISNDGTCIGEPLKESHRQHAQFVSQNRGLFVDRTSVVDHALVYSATTMFWQYCYYLTTLYDTPNVGHFGAAGRLLEDRQVPYNVLMLGHRDVFDDTYDLASLGNYKTIILPYVECVSDQQADALKDWTQAGGKLVLWAEENVGTRDEELAVRSTQAFDDLIASPGSGTVEIISTSLTNNYTNEVEGADDTIAAQIADAVTPVVETSAPETVWLNVWQHGAGPMTSVQMFNNDINVGADTFTPATSFTVTLREPNGVTWTHADFYNTDYDGAIPTTPTSLAITRNGDYVEVTVPQLDMFGVLAFTVDNELTARMEAGQTRKWYERLKMALRCPDANLATYATLLSDSKTLLDQIQGDVVVSNFSSLISPLQTKGTELESALNAVTTAVTAVQAADNSAAINVTAAYKFDFGEAGAQPGWTQITTSSSYSASPGYGWTIAGYKTAVDHGDTDLLHRDFIRSKDPADEPAGGVGDAHYPFTNPDTHPGHFRVDLPNDDYIVTVITGDYDEFKTYTGGPANEGRTPMTCVEAEGMPVLYGDRNWPGYFPNRTFRTTVTDGHLDLVFSGRAVGPLYCNPIEWLVNGLIIQTTAQTPTTAAQTYLDRADLMSASAIRDWYVLGPFDDDDCLGLETTFGPEDSNDLSQSYTGKGGTISWQLLPTLQGRAPYISFRDTFSDPNEVAAFAVSHVYCPSATNAVLVCSISQAGIVYINNNEVFVDELATGLLPEEQFIDISLDAGWNAITHFRKSLSIDPKLPVPHNELARINFQLGNFQKAVEHYRNALKLKPDWIDVLNNLAHILATRQQDLTVNPAEALTLARRACELTNYKSPAILDTLAIAQAATGKFEQAQQTALKAIQLAESANRHALAERITERLKLYQAGRPYLVTSE